MKSLQHYIEVYREIAENLNITGQSSELLIQMLANASYISEVENINYAQEASLERAGLINSKIHHCMNEMYSVFRGQCPRVVLRFRPSKFLNLNVYDPLIVSDNFKVYYLGWYKSGAASKLISSAGEQDPGNLGHYNHTVNNTTGDNSETSSLLSGFQSGPISISPAISEDDTIYILCLLSKEMHHQKWRTDSKNTYYVEADESDLSNDLMVKLNKLDHEVTRTFSEHILDSKIFDLTIPGFGSRLYVADVLRSGKFKKDGVQTNINVEVEASWFKYSRLSEYNQHELRKISIKGGSLVGMEQEFMTSRKIPVESEIAPGIITIPETDRDHLQSIHYKANRDRYVNSIIRSNSDIGTILEEMYPEKIVTGGTTYLFSKKDSSVLEIYYVPRSTMNLLTDEEIDIYKRTRRSYFITEHIKVTEGQLSKALFNIDVELYSPGVIEDQVQEILSRYQNKFGLNLGELRDEIITLISKISNVKRVKDLGIIYISGSDEVISEEDVYRNRETTYFNINFTLTSSIHTKNTL